MSRSRSARKAKKQRSQTAEPKTDELTTDEITLESSPDSTKGLRGRRKFVLLFGFVAVLVALVYLLPAIIANTSLRNTIANRALSKLDGEVKIQAASLGWFSPIQLEQVTLVDAQGQGLVRIDKVKSEKSLWSLLTSDDFGQFVLVQPMISAQLRADGTSNIEDAVKGLFVSDEPSAETPSVFIKIENAEGIVHNEMDGNTWNISQLSGDVIIGQSDSPLKAKLTGKIGVANQPAGALQAEITFDPGSQTIEFNSGTIAVVSDQVPVGVASPFLTRFVEPIELAGTLRGQATFQWSEGGGNMSLQTEQADLYHVQLRAPNRIGAEQVNLNALQVQGQLNYSPDQISADRFICRTDVGFVKANGAVPWRQLIGLTQNGELPDSDVQAEGEIDIAKLTAMLPETTRLQPGLRFESGKLQFSLTSRPEQDARRIVFNAESTGLRAINNGRLIQWRQPVRALAVVKQTADESVLETIECQTNFAKVTGSASTQRGEVNVQGDLEQAIAELNQFFDLKGITASGIVDGTLAWQFDESMGSGQPVRIGGRFNVSNPKFVWPGKTAWQQPELVLSMQAAGSRTEDGVIRIDTGDFGYQSGQQQITGKLAQPIATGSATPWRLDCTLTGQLHEILAQCKTFVELPFDASGVADAKAQVVMAPKQIRLVGVHGEVTDMKFHGFGLNVSEPRVIVDGTVAYKTSSGDLTIPDATLASSAVSARAQQIDWRPDGTLQGNVAFRADVHRAMQWVKGPPAPESIQWFGKAEGNIQFATQANVIDCQTRIIFNDLIAAKQTTQQPGFQNVSNQNPWQTLFSEKQATLESSLRLSRAFDHLQLNDARLTSSAVNMNVAGDIKDLTGTMDSNLAGSWNPDWTRLKPLIDSYLGNVASIDGLSGEAFQIQGPILAGENHQGKWIHPDLKFQTHVSWQHGHLLGIPFGPSNCAIQMDRGIVSADSGKIAYAGGTIRLAPRIDMNGDQPLLLLDEGRHIDHVQITPEMCRGWLKYVAPILADATQAQGTLSVRTREIVVPISEIERANAGGVIEIHQGQIGPGPLAQQLASIIELVRSIAKGRPFENVPSQTAWITIPEQNISFSVKEGRVHHNGLVMQIGNVQMRTRGSVGMDQSVRMFAMIPLTDSWIGNNSLLAGMRGQELEIPIVGTVGQPRLDSSVIENLMQNLVRQSTGGAIENGLNNLLQQEGAKLENELLKGIDKIFGGGR